MGLNVRACRADILAVYDHNQHNMTLVGDTVHDQKEHDITMVCDTLHDHKEHDITKVSKHGA